MSLIQKTYSVVYSVLPASASLEDNLGIMGCNLVKSFLTFCLFPFFLFDFLFFSKAYTIQQQECEPEVFWNYLLLAFYFGYIFLFKTLPLSVYNLTFSSKMPTGPSVTPDLSPEY